MLRKSRVYLIRRIYQARAGILLSCSAFSDAMLVVHVESAVRIFALYRCHRLERLHFFALLFRFVQRQMTEVYCVAIVTGDVLPSGNMHNQMTVCHSI